MRYRLNIILPLIACLIIHLLFRANDTLLNLLVIKAGFSIPFKWFTKVPDFVMYNLPSGLWVYSLSLLSIGLYFKKMNLFFATIVIVVAIEVLQLFSFTDGTFDIIDITTPLLFFSLAWLYKIRNQIILQSPKMQKAKLAIFATLLFAIFLSDVYVN